MTSLGAILTGGSSVRMGEDKSDVQVGGLTMLERCHKAIVGAVDNVVLLGPDRDGYAAWPDMTHSRGPLSGIATALSRAQADHVLVVAVDQPFVRRETLRTMIELAGESPLVPVDTGGVRQVTCAVYPTTIAERAVHEANSGGSIQTLLDAVSFQALPPEVWQTWGEDGRSWFSCDTAAAIDEGLARFS